MPSEIYLVKVGMTMEEGTVEEWYIADGDRVEPGEMLYRLETEKVNLDVDAETAGTVKHLADAGTTCKPGDVVGFIYADDETIPDVLPTPKPKLDIAVAGDASANDTPPKPAAARPKRAAGAASPPRPLPASSPANSASTSPTSPVRARGGASPRKMSRPPPTRRRPRLPDPKPDPPHRSPACDGPSPSACTAVCGTPRNSPWTWKSPWTMP